jgi:hypothetical protein
MRAEHFRRRNLVSAEHQPSQSAATTCVGRGTGRGELGQIFVAKGRGR